MEYIDPTDVAGLNERARAWAAPGEQIHPVQIDHIIVEEDAIGSLSDEVRTLSGGKRVLVVLDHTPMCRGGDDLKPLVEAALARVCEPTVRRLPEKGGCPLHAEFDIARRLADELAAPDRNFAAIVSVGSGSVTDLAKYARHLHARETGDEIPFVCFPTAASVTAYTSALAVLAVAGVKRTLPALPPDIVICDLRTLGDAPRIMTQAGFGDVLARSVSYGDWYLANQLGMGDGFSLVPGRILEHAEEAMLREAPGVAASEPGGVHAVTDALLLSGMVMSMAGQTAPLSGWEHAISHFCDLTAAGDGRPAALHGGQVAVATLVSARAYQSAWSDLDLEGLMSCGDDASYRKTLERVFGPYDSTGDLLAELWRDFAKKLSRWREAADTRRRFVERKRAGQYDSFIREAVRPAAEVEAALREAGAPRRFCDLDEPVSQDTAESAVRFAHLVRARFTLGDLLSESGWLDDSAADLLEGLT